MEHETITFDKEWESARKTMILLLKQENVTKQQWQELFETVHRICTWVDDGALLTRESFESEVKRHVNSAEKVIRCDGDENILIKKYSDEWSKFNVLVEYLPKPFCYTNAANCEMDVRFFGANRYIFKGISFVSARMLYYWNEIIFSVIKDKLRSAAMKLVETERNGEVVDSRLIMCVRESYVSLNQEPEKCLAAYHAEFEKMYIDCTGAYYDTRAAEVMENNPIEVYMLYAEEKLLEEEERGRRYLEPSSNSLKKLMERCVHILVTRYRESLVESFDAYLWENNIETLSRVYRLIDRTQSGIDTLLNFFDAFIKKAVNNGMVANAKSILTDPEKYIEELLSLFNQFTSTVSLAFSDDPRFLTTRDKAFQYAVNDTSVFNSELNGENVRLGSAHLIESRCPELLANFCDMMLRKTPISRRLDSDQIDAKLNQVLLVLKYISSKDLFMRYYKAHMTRRLVLEISADLEKEEVMITKLRDIGMPAEYLSRLSRMFQDVELNRDYNIAFKNSLSPTCSFSNLTEMVSFKVLNGAAWARIDPTINVQIPRRIEEISLQIDTFYRNQHNGRKLYWYHHWSHGTTVFSSQKGKYDLEVTMLQLSVLLCWNDAPKRQFSFESLKLATQLPAVDLSRVLHSLAMNPRLRHQILLTDAILPPNNIFNDSALFSLNQQFAVVKGGKEQSRGKANLIGRLQLNTDQNLAAEQGEILHLRKLRVQEAIAKIMKARKSCTDAQLQSELIEIVKNLFHPSRRLIKEQIEELIEKKFMERDPNDLQKYLYIS